MTSPLATITPGDPLTERELEVLRLIANGHTMRQTATRLFIGYHTVKTHVARAGHKVGGQSVAHTVSLAIRSRQLRPAEIQPTDAIRDRA